MVGGIKALWQDVQARLLGVAAPPPIAEPPSMTADELEILASDIQARLDQRPEYHMDTAGTATGFVRTPATYRSGL